MENHTFISATFEYEEKMVEKNVDFWEKMYDDPIRLLLIGPMEIIFFVIYVPAFIGIFEYIRMRPVKTVLTHIERGMYCYIFFYIVVGYTISIVKGYYGPYPSVLCWWLKWIYNFVPIGLLLSFCVNIIIRYLTIVNKNSFVLSSNDQFFNIYLNLCIFLASMTSAFLNNLTPGKFGINYYMCTGQDPSDYDFLGKKFPVAFLMTMFTLLISGIVSTRVYFLRRKLNQIDQAEGQWNQVSKPKGFSKYFPYVNHWARSVLGLISLYFGVIFIIVDTIVWNNFTKDMTPKDFMNQTTFKGKFLLLFHQVASTNVPILFLILTTYGRKKDLRKYVWAEFKGLWQTLYYRIMQPLPILAQGGLSLPIIPIPLNSPPPNHSVLTPNSILTSTSLTSLPHLPSSKFQSTPSVTLTLTPRPLIIPSPIEITPRELGQCPSDCSFTAFENNTRINRPKSASHKINSGIEDSTSLYQFKSQSGKNSGYQETNSIKTCYNNPPNSPTRKHSVLTLTPSSQPNRPLTSLPPSSSTHFQTTPLVTITPAPRTLINAIPFKTPTRKLAQSPNDGVFTALENNTRIKRPKSSSIPHMHANNFTIEDSISLCQFDYQSGLYPETDSIKTLYF